MIRPVPAGEYQKRRQATLFSKLVTELVTIVVNLSEVIVVSNLEMRCISSADRDVFVLA